MQGTNILFVSTGNICRSAMAEALTKHWVTKQGMRNSINVSSCAVTPTHTGQPADRRVLRILEDASITTIPSVARYIQKKTDFLVFDTIVVMDMSHVYALKRLGQELIRPHQIYLFTDIMPEMKGQEIADPYMGTMQDFKSLYDVLYPGCELWVNWLASKQKSKTNPKPANQLNQGN